MPRIAVTDDFSVSETLTEPGEYAVYYDAEGRITQVWVVLPEVGLVHVPGEHYDADHIGARWKITEDSEGRVTIKDSIESRQPMPDRELYWHGFLTAGELRPV